MKNGQSLGFARLNSGKRSVAHRPAQRGGPRPGPPARRAGRRRHRVLPAGPDGGLGARLRRAVGRQPRARADQRLRLRPDRPVHGERPGFGTVAETGSGFAYINGWPETPPTSPPFGFADSIAGISAAMGTAMALFRRGARPVRATTSTWRSTSR